MGRLRVTRSLGPSCGDNWDSTKARSSRARPRPLGAQKGPCRGCAGDSRSRPSPTACTPASRPGTRTSAADGAEQGDPRSPPPSAARPRGSGVRAAPAGRGCGRKPSLQYLGEEVDRAAAAATAGGGGSGGGGGAGHSPSHCPGPARGPQRPESPGPRPLRARPRCWPLPCSDRLSPALTLLIPGKLERALGANPQTKSETSAAGREWLLVGALPLLPPHPLPAVSRAVP